eukprot:UN07756
MSSKDVETISRTDDINKSIKGIEMPTGFNMMLTPPPEVLTPPESPSLDHIK